MYIIVIILEYQCKKLLFRNAVFIADFIYFDAGRCTHYFIRDINLLADANVQRIVEDFEALVADPYSYLTTR